MRRSFDIIADVDIHDGHPGGVIFAQGSHIGGHTLYVKDGRLNYVYNWLGEIQQKITSSKPLEAGKHTVVLRFDAKGQDEFGGAVGPARLLVDDEEVGAADIKTQPAFFGLEGVVTVGRDTGKPASGDYESPDTFTGGVIERVTVAVKGPRHRDPQKEAEIAARRD